jgi:hypothetical protein
VYNYPEIPKNGEMYEFDGKLIPQFICRGVHATKLTDSPDSHWWEVEAKYKWAGAPDFDDDDYDDEEPKYDESSVSINSGTIIVPTVARYDYFGKKILNSAGQPFDPPPQYDRRIVTYSISRTEYNNPLKRCLDYGGTVNSKKLWGLDPFTILITEIKASKSIVYSGRNQGKTAWNVTYELAVDTAVHGQDKDGEDIYGWQTAAIDCGRKTLVSQSNGNYALESIRDGQGLEFDEPQRLDGQGKRLDDGLPDVYLCYMLHPQANLFLLCLPNPFRF